MTNPLTTGSYKYTPTPLTKNFKHTETVLTIRGNHTNKGSRG